MFSSFLLFLLLETLDFLKATTRSSLVFSLHWTFPLVARDCFAARTSGYAIIQGSVFPLFMLLSSFLFLFLFPYVFCAFLSFLLLVLFLRMDLYFLLFCFFSSTHIFRVFLILLILPVFIPC